MNDDLDQWSEDESLDSAARRSGTTMKRVFLTCDAMIRCASGAVNWLLRIAMRFQAYILGSDVPCQWPEGESSDPDPSRSDPTMKRVLLTLDAVIRYASVAVIWLLGFPMLVLACIMGTDTGTTGAIVFSACVFFIGTGVLIGLTGLSKAPEEVERFFPGPPLVGKVIVRIPAYIFGTAGLFLLLRQIWYVAIPDMLR